MKYLLKYLFIGIGYLLLWAIFIPSIVLERIFKCIVVAIKILWHFRIKKEWFKIFDTYFFCVPLPLLIIIFFTWRINNLKDFFLLRNWELYFTENKEESDKLKNSFVNFRFHS